MKKILHVFNHYLPKTENWAYQLISHTPDCEQHIASKVYLENTPGKDLFQFMENSQSALEAEDQKTNWKKNILKKAYIRASKSLRIGFNKQLLQYIAKNKIDLVHAHFANMGWEVQSALKDIDIPIIVSFYGWDYEMLPYVKPEWKSKYKEMFNLVNLILVEGEHGKNVLNRKGCPEKKIKIQKLGIERSLIKHIKRDKKRDELKLIQIASFTEKKGQLYSVKAFEEALKTCSNMHLTLIGDSREEAYYNEVIKFINENKLHEKISIRDFIPYVELENELSKHQVFIHPSCYAQNKNCEGGAPTIIFNAAGSGLPTIATTHCDIPSLVIDGQSGMLSIEKDVGTLAENIIEFYKMESEQYVKFCITSQEHITDNYCIENNGISLTEIYNELLTSVS